MDFDIKCRSTEQAAIAADKIKCIMLELGVRADNIHIGSGLGGNNRQLMIMLAMDHVITDKQAGVFFDKHVCYWNVSSVVNSTRVELRQYINTAFEQKVANSNVGPALLLGHLLSEGAESKFLDRYETDSTDLPEVNLILEGHQFDINKVARMDLLLVSAVAAGLMSRMLDKLPEAKPVELPAVNNVGSFFVSIPAETSLLVLRSMVGINRLIMRSLDENAHWDKVLSVISSTLKL